MEENNKKGKIGIIITAIALVAVLLVSFTYAYFTSRDESSVQEIKTSNMDIEFDDTTDIVKADNIIPLTEEEALPKTDGTIDIASSKATVKTFSITNNGSETIYVDIKLTDIVAENFKVYDLKWALYENTTPITTGNFASLDDTENEITLTTNIELATTEANKKTYNLLIWIHENEQDQSVLMNKNLTLKISTEANQTKSKTLASQILGDNNAKVLTTTPTFNETSTDVGLYEQSENSKKSNYGFSTYYYKGNVENNYVKFGTYKTDVTNMVMNNETEEEVKTQVASAGDDILWRVVRINEDGSIKLIAQNSIGTTDNVIHVFNSKGKPLYINEDGSNSEIKTTLNNWYTNDITINESLIQNGNYCNDFSQLKGLNTGVSDLDVVGRLWVTSPPAPIFTCSNVGVMINEKVGLITADEIVFGGGLPTKAVTNNTTYLNNKTSFWTMSPYTSANYAIYWDSYSLFLDKDNGTNPDYSSARPVITIKADTVITGGDGSSSTPWIIG